MRRLTYFGAWCAAVLAALITDYQLTKVLGAEAARSVNVSSTGGLARVIGDEQPNAIVVNVQQGMLQILVDGTERYNSSVGQVHTVLVQGLGGEDSCTFMTDQAYDADRIIAALNNDDFTKTYAWMVLGHDVSVIAAVERLTTTVHR